MKTEDIKLIEDYLDGKLEHEVLNAFETRLHEDPGFAIEVERHKLFISKLKRAGSRLQLKDKLDGFHEQLSVEDTLYKVSAGKKFSSFLALHYTTIAVAASVAIITVSAMLFSIDYVKQSGNKQFAYYKELKRDIEKLKKSQKAIINTLDEKVEIPNMGATAFVISKKGYLLTSYHTVRGADSLIVENEKYKRLKVKVIFVDPQKDLALLKISDRKFKTFSNMNLAIVLRKAKLGEKVFTLGYSKEDIVYGEGSVSSATGYEGDAIACQVSVPVNPGNSGSPLFDNNGNIIGMISGKHIHEEGSAFAIKPGYLLDFIRSAPRDSIADLKMNKTANNFSNSRPEQIDKMKDFVLMLKVYKN